MMVTFHATLNLEFEAKDHEEALEMAEAAKAAVLTATKFKFTYVEIDDLELA